LLGLLGKVSLQMNKLGLQGLGTCSGASPLFCQTIRLGHPCDLVPRNKEKGGSCDNSVVRSQDEGEEHKPTGLYCERLETMSGAR
jgi:hypothetical protein